MSPYPSNPRLAVRVPTVLALALILCATAVVACPPASARSGSGSEARYLVRRGDTLSDIAQAHHTTVTALARANGLADPQLIYAGTWLVLPASSGGASGGGAPGGSSYVVRPGDTLSGIAKRFGLSAQTLAQANGLADPDLIVAGKRLTIPALGRTGTSGATSSSTVSTGGRPAALSAHPDRLALVPLFQRWAAAYGVPVDLLESMAWMESGWQTGVVSRAGAIGVMQLMPATVTFVSHDLLHTSLDPWSASDNIRMGARYLRYLMDLAHGNVATAVAAYYQGFASVTGRGMYSDTVAYQQGILSQRGRFG